MALIVFGEGINAGIPVMATHESAGAGSDSMHLHMNELRLIVYFCNAKIGSD